LTDKKLHEIHKELVYAQGRKPAWIAQQLGCSYSYVYQYLNGLKTMSEDKVSKLHKILIG
jgi:hypothetical protein